MVNVNDAVKAMWAAIQKDADEGLVPVTVRSFSELHDHVDANLYLIEAFPHLADLDTYGDEELRLFNAASSIIDERLKSSRCDAPIAHDLNGCGCRKSS